MIYDVKASDFDEYIGRVKQINCGQSKMAYVFTFGCQQNEADSEKIVGMAKAMGYGVCDNPDDADMIILNTCAIRQHAEEKALSMLGRFKSLKKKNSELIIGVCGCMAAEEHVKELLKNDFHYVTFTLEPNMLHKIPYLVYRALTEGKRTFVIHEDKGDIHEGVPAVRKHDHKAWVSIMYGCNNFCTYCIVPYVRGRERSRSVEDILIDCRMLVANGVKEITLLGQNVNSYSGECDFASLISKIAEIDGDFIIRFMTSHPKDVSDRLIDVMKRYSPKVAPYFHLPLQSGSNRILKAMNRTYKREQFLQIVDKLRENVPGICLSTDVIVGFPSETERDFLDTLDILEKARFDMVYAFKYSPRERTPAAKMSDMIDMDTKTDRIDRLLKLQDGISLENNERYVGRRETVLVDSISKHKGKNVLNARTYSNKLVHLEGDESMIGKYISVKIERAGVYELYAKQITENEV